MNSEQLAEWDSNPTTIEIKKLLTELRGALAESLATGGTLGVDPGETALLTARIVGKIEGLDEFLGLEYKEEPLTGEEQG